MPPANSPYERDAHRADNTNNGAPKFTFQDGDDQTDEPYQTNSNINYIFGVHSVRVVVT